MKYIYIPKQSSIMKTLVTFLGLGHLLDRKDAGGCCWYQSADWSDDYKKRGMSLPHSVWRTLPHEGKTPDDRPGFEMSDLDSQYWVCKRLTSIQAWRNWFFKATQCKIWTCSTCQIRTMLNAVICSHDFIDWVVFSLQELGDLAGNVWAQKTVWTCSTWDSV